MKRILYFITFLLCVPLSSTNAQQYVSVDLRKQFMDSIRSVHPHLSQDELRTVLTETFRSTNDETSLLGRITESFFRQDSDVTLLSQDVSTASTVYNAVADSIEFRALKALFEATGGENWMNKENWPYENWPRCRHGDMARFCHLVWSRRREWRCRKS